MAATTEPVRRGGSRLAPTLIVVLFLAPMLAAWVAFKYFPEQMRSLGTNNYGELVHPPREVPMAGLIDLAGEPLTTDWFRDKWTYLYVDGSDCDARCRAVLFEMRQVRLTQGAEMDRVQRLFVVTDDQRLAELRTLLEQEYPGQRTVLADAAAVRALGDALTSDSNRALSERVYVVDPLGRVMMYYEPVASADKDDVLTQATGMRKDMAKLLKNSKTQ